MPTPIKYRPKFCGQLVAHMSKGQSFDSFGGEIGVCHRTLYNWLETYDDFLTAKLEGELKALSAWEKIGINGMIGKIKGFNAVSWIFLGKCRFRRYGYRDYTDDQQALKPPGNKNEASAALEELKAMIRDTACQPTRPSSPASPQPQLVSGLLGASSDPKSTQS